MPYISLEADSPIFFSQDEPELLSQEEPVLLSQFDPGVAVSCITFTCIGNGQTFIVPSEPHNKEIKIGHAKTHDGSIQIYDKELLSKGEPQLIHGKHGYFIVHTSGLWYSQTGNSGARVVRGGLTISLVPGSKARLEEHDQLLFGSSLQNPNIEYNGLAFIVNMPGGKTIGCGMHTSKKRVVKTAMATVTTTAATTAATTTSTTTAETISATTTMATAGGKKRKASFDGADQRGAHAAKKNARKEYARHKRVNKARSDNSSRGVKSAQGKGGKGKGKGKGGKGSSSKKSRFAAEAVAFWRKQRRTKEEKIKVQTSSGGVCTIARYCR
jgi:hypothetical protein